MDFVNLYLEIMMRFSNSEKIVSTSKFETFYEVYAGGFYFYLKEGVEEKGGGTTCGCFFAGYKGDVILDIDFFII
jgi:hypothetical protein